VLKIATIVKESSINGVGVFTCQFIPKGTVTWEYDVDYDIAILPNDYRLLSGQLKDYIDKYAYEIKNGNLILCGDNAKFENHSDKPNQIYDRVYDRDIAAIDIPKDTELTINYYDFDYVTIRNNKI
jgi:SET domain-containing protein